MKQRFDQHHSQAPKLEVGQLVFMQKPPDHTGEPTKTQVKYRGPLVITAALPCDTYRVTSLVPTKGKKFFTTNAHILLLKPWGRADTPSLDEDTDSDPEDTDDCEVFNEPVPNYDLRQPPSPLTVVPGPLQEDEEVEDTPVPAEERGVRKRTKPRWMSDFV
ncbi:hypothetical protein B566_EDAN018297 [Ephemera danica]|nr:hypothetical protein B566_EDAN018297 [Ephemera danica]